MRPTWSRVLLAVLLLLLAAVTVHGQPTKPPLMPLVMPRGALITYVEPEGPGDKAGLEVGDVILSVNGVAVTSEAVLQQALKLSPFARLEVLKREEAQRVIVIAFPQKDSLGVMVTMVDPESRPFFPRYRRWV